MTIATTKDAAGIAGLLNQVAAELTVRHGPGHWSMRVSEKGVARAIKTAEFWVVREGARVIATLMLATRRPWAIDRSYFTDCRRPLYLTSMAVAPEVQGRGIGRACLAEAIRIAAEWPGDAIRLDAYDSAAGAAPFYAKCGFREVARVEYHHTPLVYFEKLLGS